MDYTNAMEVIQSLEDNYGLDVNYLKGIDTSTYDQLPLEPNERVCLTYEVLHNITNNTTYTLEA